MRKREQARDFPEPVWFLLLLSRPPCSLLGKLALVSTGPYRYIRHPIYALRLGINVCAFIVAPVPRVLLTAGLDFLLLQIEARRAERYMQTKHGADYERYKNSVGRFVPRAFVG